MFVLSLLRALLATVSTLLGLAAALPLVLIGLPFWGVAALTRAGCGLIRLFQGRAVPWEQLMQFEPTIGWRPKAHLHVRATADRVFQLTTDADGWRGTTRLEESDIVVFGDSFAFGHGADDSQFFAQLHPTVRIKAIGANGYSMVQELLWMERLSPDLRGRLVVWLVYYGNDLYDNLRPNLGHYRSPFLRSNDTGESWEVVTSHVSPEPWPFPTRVRYYEKLAEICSPTFLSQRVFSACEFLIGRGRDLCEEAGAALVVVGIPDTTQMSAKDGKRLLARAPDPRALDPGLPDRKLREICRKLDLQFVTLKDHLRRGDFKVGDCHWNRGGHQRVAKVLGDLHKNLPVTARSGATRVEPERVS